MTNMDSKNFFKERRNQKRFKQKSIIKINGKEAFLSEISENGLRVAVLIVPDKEIFSVELSIAGKNFDLSGKLVWKGNSKSYTGLYDIGISIEVPPKRYVKFISSLDEES